MKILGIGTDIVNIKRLEKLLKKKKSVFKSRIFSKNEILYCDKKMNPYPFYAKRYAAKEACSKALGTGLAKGIFWKDVEVVNDKYGKPFIKLHNNALKRINKITKKDYKIEVSLSDEKNYAIANVIIFINEK